MALTGSSQDIPLADVLQVGANNRQTCRIVVRAPSGDGALYLDGGELVHASCGAEVGVDAACQLLAEPDVSYRIELGAVAGRRTIDLPCTQVLLEAARRADEADANRMPTGPTRPALPRPVSVIGRRRIAGVIVRAAAAGVLLGVLIAGISLVARDRGDTPLMTSRAQPAAVPAAGSAAAIAAVADPEVPPRPLSAPPPVAPAASALAPTIAVRVLVDEQGIVRDARIYRSRLDLAAWEDAALDAVATWRFTPAQHAGAAVAAWVNVPVSFARAAPGPVRITVKGSDTIGGEHGVGTALAAAFEAVSPGAKVKWEGLGSATAFVGLLDGSADIGASSRPASPKEIAEAERIGVTLTEYVLGYDGIAVIVHPDAPVRQLTMAQPQDVFTGATGSWSSLGGRDRPIHRIGRPSYSGTHAFFRDKVLHGAEFAADTRAIEKSDDIVAAVAADPDAIAYVTAGRVTEAVRAVPIVAPGGVPVAASVETIRDGSYPIYRPLLLYVRGQPTTAAAALLRFCLSADGQRLVAKAGFVSSDVPEDVVAAPGADAAPSPHVALRVGFGAGTTTLARTARSALWQLAEELRDGDERIVLTGNADGVGGAGGNDALARRRADAVAAYLRRAGIAPERITVEASGADAPVATNRTRAGRDANRRVDVVVVPRR